MFKNITEVKCPEVLKDYFDYNSIFLAGGITNCPDWQHELLVELDKYEEMSYFKFINPRRDDFDVTKAESSVKQISWEHDHLMVSDKYIFYFPKEGLCSITLFELGKIMSMLFWSDEYNWQQNILVAVHPEYVRAFDVKEQCKHFDVDVVECETIQQLSESVYKHFIEE